MVLPCPYTAVSSTLMPWRPSMRGLALTTPTAGLLGPCPAQSFYTAATLIAPPYVPTNNDHAMNSLSMYSLDDQFYMDTGATSHMSNSPGNLSSYFQLSNTKQNAIVVGNGSMIPVCGHGSASLPTTNPLLHLKNVLHAPNLIKNLIFI